MIKFKNLFKYAIPLLVTLVLLVAIHFTQVLLDKQVSAHRLRFTGQIKNAPPAVIFTTVALGSFRGLVADLLWLRAGALKDKGSYFEQAQLARWITDLQPTFSGATAYLAWNMAYNISVTCSTAAERWRWVNEGIRLIRDRALDYNPEDFMLYKELAWIFQHKLGNILDEGNLYYKNQTAVSVMNIVGSKVPNWEKLGKAPKSYEDFLKKYPSEHRIWKIIGENGFTGYDDLYEYFKNQTPAALPEKLVLAFRRSKKTAGLEEDLLNSFQAKLLYERLRLDTAVIAEINRKYGLLDWRIPESQAIYWATMGIRCTPGRHDISLDRVITQSLYESFKAGRLLMIDENKFEDLVVVPNLALMEAVYQSYVDAQEYHKGKDSGRDTSFFTARMNFLKEAIVILFNYGDFTKAEKYYKILVADDGPKDKERSLEEFVIKEFASEVHSANVKQASEIISGLIYRSITFMLLNDQDAAVAQERLARYIYSKYAVGQGKGERQRLPAYNVMKKTVVEQALKSFPPALSAVLRSRLAAEQFQRELTPVKK